MPAPAVIPAPIAYVKVVAVKKLVVGLRPARPGADVFSTSGRAGRPRSPICRPFTLSVVTGRSSATSTLNKSECSRRACVARTIKQWMVEDDPPARASMRAFPSAPVWRSGRGPWFAETDGGIRTWPREVKFLDRPKTNGCESVCQARFRWSRTKVGGSKTIRYRPSSDRQRCRLGLAADVVFGLARGPSRGKPWSVRVPGEVRLQSWNLKELTEGYHQEWSLRLNLTQHGATHRVRTRSGLTDRELFHDSVGGGAWPFLVGGAICLVDSVNERDLALFSIRASYPFGGSHRPSQRDRRRFPSRSWRGNNRSVMPLDVPGRTRATLSAAASLKRFPILSGEARPCNGARAWDRRLQWSVSNEEFLVGTGHQPASITSLPFVHTPHRYYRSNGLVRPSESSPPRSSDRGRARSSRSNLII